MEERGGREAGGGRREAGGGGEADDFWFGSPRSWRRRAGRQWGSEREEAAVQMKYPACTPVAGTGAPKCWTAVPRKAPLAGSGLPLLLLLLLLLLPLLPRLLLLLLLPPTCQTWHLLA